MVALLTVVTFFAEPEFKGKTLSQWIDVLNRSESVSQPAMEAIVAIGEDGAKKSIPALCTLWKRTASARPYELGGIAKSLGAFGEKAAPAVPLLLEGMKSDLGPKFDCAVALGAIGAEPKRCVPAIAALLRARPDNSSAWMVALALVRFGEAAESEILKCLKDKSREVRSATCSGIANHGAATEKVVELLNELATTDKDAEVKRQAAEAVKAVKAKAAK